MITRRTVLTSLAAAGLSPFVPVGVRRAAAQEAGVIRFASAKPAGDMNPHVYNGLWGAQDLIFEPLIVYGQGGELQPGLATAWTLSADGLRLDLDLREGVTFHDGTPWNAEALRWNLERWIHDDNHQWMNHARLFEDLEVLDVHKVAMRFSEPPLGLLYELTYTRPVRFLSPGAVDAEGGFAEPVGTGPWRQVAASNSASDFERFEEYWGDKPQFQRLELKVLPDSRGRMAALRAGDVDVIGGDFLAPIRATEAKTLMDAGFDVEVSWGITMLIGFNPDRAPALADADVRRAISLGFDRAAIAQVIYQGLAEPAGSFFPEGVPFAGTRFPVDARDPDAARALLEGAGWTGDGIRQKDGAPLALELVISEDQIPGSRSLAEVMQAQLGEIGIDLSIRLVDHASRHSDIPARNYDLATFLTFGTPYEPYGTMVGYLYSPYDNGVDGKLVVDPENLDPLMMAAMSASEAEAQEKLQAVFDWMHAGTAFLPVLYSPSFWAHADRVAGFRPPATAYDTPYEGLHVVEG